MVAGYPIKDVRVRLYDGQYHTVDSSEMAFKIAGSMAFKQAAAEADAYLLEPIVKLTISVPEDAVGDVIGDLNSRRGHPLGMEPKGSMTEIEAEVPMAEVLDYAPDLRAITGGRGDYTMEFERYEELPGAPRPEGDRRGRRPATRARQRLSAPLRRAPASRPRAVGALLRWAVPNSRRALELRRLRAHDPARASSAPRT